MFHTDAVTWRLERYAICNTCSERIARSITLDRHTAARLIRRLVQAQRAERSG